MAPHIRGLLGARGGRSGRPKSARRHLLTVALDALPTRSCPPTLCCRDGVGARSQDVDTELAVVRPAGVRDGGLVGHDPLVGLLSGPWCLADTSLSTFRSKRMILVINQKQNRLLNATIDTLQKSWGAGDVSIKIRDHATPKVAVRLENGKLPTPIEYRLNWDQYQNLWDGAEDEDALIRISDLSTRFRRLFNFD